MEHLVYWNCKEKNSALPKQINEFGDTVGIEDICAQLATIYDIVGDMSMDRMKELVDADREGRCEILPTKKIFSMLGSDVYVVNDGDVLNALLCFIGYTPDGIGCIEAVYNPCFEDEKGFVFKFSDVGEKVFLTKESSEFALSKEVKK